MDVVDITLQVIYAACLLSITYLSHYFMKISDSAAFVATLDGAFLGIVAMAALHYRIKRIEKRKRQST